MASAIASPNSLLLQSSCSPSPLASSPAASRRAAAAPAIRLVRVRAEASSSPASTSTVAAGPINPSIKKDEPKVVDTVVASELQKPLQAYCRCWRSNTFPLCDGTHVKHNKETGDNVGPLLLKK